MKRALVINISAGRGSTGRIASECARYAEEQGAQALSAYGRYLVNDGVSTIRIGNDFDLRAHAFLSRLFDNSGFWSKRETRKFLKKMDKYDPDFLWLHNIHGYYINIEMLFDWIKSRPNMEVRWTLHDCWAFTGHCAHFACAKCDKWLTGCFNCPQKKEYPASLLYDNSKRNYERKKAAFTGVKNMTLYTPSQWMANFIEKSFLKEYPVIVKHNQIDKTKFRPIESEFRAQHHIQSKIMILGVAGTWGKTKGLDVFVELAGLLDERFALVVVGVNKKQIEALPKRIISIERTNNIDELCGIYTTADVLLNPSREESFGMTTLEALACGTTPIVYKDTACEEVANIYGGIAIEQGVESVYNCLMGMFSDK